jgi:uncharacterized membrane protein YjgN (DUF898 family)
MSDTAASGPWGAPPTISPVGAGPKRPNNLDEMTVEFVGKRGALFWLALKTGFFTILTLGFYRFWMKTRLRRWYWSAMRPGGHPMEYVGDPIEKLLGFFIAVVILTFYIGIVNLLLMFVSFSVFSSSWLGYAASFAGVIPLWFYASYRARRYVLGRTRWRGVRFGLEKGAWGYAGLALWSWALTILSLGVLWPRMTFMLEKYRTDRTFFGSARLYQGGRWTLLYRAADPFVGSLILLVGMLVLLLWVNPVVPSDEFGWAEIMSDVETLLQGDWSTMGLVNPLRLVVVPFALSGMLFGAIYYRWVSKRIMAQHKSADGVQFASSLSSLRVTFIYVLGNFLSYIVLVLGIVMLVFMAAGIFGFGFLPMAAQSGTLGTLASLPRWATLLMLGIVYLSVFLLWGVLHNTFVTFPLMRHMAQTTELSQIAGLGQISQRARDEFAEAEGFAEALDLGAAI